MLLYMKPLYSTLKLISFLQKRTHFAPCLFYFFPATVLLQSYKECKIQVNAHDSQLNYSFVQLTAGCKTSLNNEISCAIIVQRRVNYGNLMNIFVYRNHVD